MMVVFSAQMLNVEGHLEFAHNDHARPNNRVIHGDNLEVLDHVDSESLDVIYVDPPFGTGQRQLGPRAAYRDSLADMDSFMPWIKPRLEGFRRCLKSSGSLFVHLDYRSVHYVKVYLDELFGRARFVNEIIWCYSVGGKSKKRFARKHDTILWYSKSKDYAFYPDAIRIPHKGSSHMRKVVDDQGRTWREKTHKKSGRIYRYPVDEGKIPEDWWSDVATLNRSDAERCGWPTQKPVRLLKRLLEATSRQDDAVADFFMGSGTCVVAAQVLGRQFIGVDAMRESVKCTLERLARAAQHEPGLLPPPNIQVENCGSDSNWAEFLATFETPIPRQASRSRGTL